MLGRLLKAAGAILLAMSASVASASAQNYDGSGLVKFGVFGQGTFLNVDQSLPAIASGSPSGFTYGVTAGYDLTFRRHMLIGIEVDGSFGDARETVGATDYGHDYMVSVRGRLGFFAMPNLLVYGTAGVGFLGFEAHQPGVGIKTSETATGFVGGGGLEWDLGRVILFSEYLYGNFGDVSFSLPQPGLLPPIAHRADLDSHAFRIGVKFKVGHDYAHDSFVHPEDYRNLK